eukprot:Phypoly_transcript_06835.p1 GENE.Phypoly_transcript_06835~~Phypoly_transcript_06835.p1  ORF type:complete len:429 (+),score=73.59 Phypoly_transcript_06835:191-1477(+)
MQKSVVQVWVNDSSCKQINITPSSTCEDIITCLAEQYSIPKRAISHLELHVVHNGKEHSTVPREEKITSHLASLAESGVRIDESSHKYKYVLVVNHDAVKKAQKLSGQSKSWSPLSYFKKRTSSHQRSISLPTTPEDTNKPKGLSVSANALLKARPQDSILESEKMPSQLPNNAAHPHLTPRSEISPPRAGMRARSKTLSPSLSTNDLRNQEALNQMITQRIRNRSSLNYERPPLTDPHLYGDFNDGQHSPRLLGGTNAYRSSSPLPPSPNMHTAVPSSSPRAASPPPPQRLFEPPPTIVHLSPSTSSSSISFASASLPATAPRQRSLTTSGALGNRLTPPRSQLAEMTIGHPTSAGKHEPFDFHSSTLSSSSSTSSISLVSSSYTSLSSCSSLSSTSSPSLTSNLKKSDDDEHLELLAVVDRLKKAS